MRAIQHTPSQQIVTRNPSQLVMSNNTPGQHLMRSTSSQHLARPSSSSQLPRCVSVKKNKDGSKEVVVETSVKVSYTFQQEGYQVQDCRQHCERAQDIGQQCFKGQDDGQYHNADYLAVDHVPHPGHQLVCCSCLQSLSCLQVGECGCLACRACLDQLVKAGFCNNCQANVRYMGLEKIIRFPDKGKMSKLFMTSGEREKMSTKEFLIKVLKEEKEFKIVDRILNKQEAAFAGRTRQTKEELKKIVREEEELKRKILAKSAIISDLEESIRSKSLHQFQQYTRPLIQHQTYLQIQHEANQDVQHKVNQYNVQKDDNLHIQHEAKRYAQHEVDQDQDQMDLEAIDRALKKQDEEWKYAMHMARPEKIHKVAKQEVLQKISQQFQCQAEPKQVQHEVNQQLEHKGALDEHMVIKRAIQQEENEDRKMIKSPPVEIVLQPVAGLKSILKKKIACRIKNVKDEQYNSHSGGVAVDWRGDHSQVKDKVGEQVTRQTAGLLYGNDGQSLNVAHKNERNGAGGKDLSAKKMEEACQEGKIGDTNEKFKVQADIVADHVPGDWNKMATPRKKRERMEDIQDRSLKTSSAVKRRLEDMSNRREDGKAMPQGPVNSGKAGRNNERSGQKPGLVSAAQWMDRAVRGETAGAGSRKDRLGQSMDGGKHAGKQPYKAIARKTLPPLAMIRNPTSENVKPAETVVESRRKDKLNMTYDYLDMIVSRGGGEGGEKARAEFGLMESSEGGGEEGTIHDLYGAQGLAKLGRVAAGNSKLFWDQYLL